MQKRILLPLTISCPPNCVCKSIEPKYWNDPICGDPLFITQYGDVMCKHHQGKGKGEFIKDYPFQCEKAKQSNTWYKYKSVSNLLMAISYGFQKVINELPENDG